MDEVHAIPRTIVDAQLGNTAADGRDIAEIPLTGAFDPSQDSERAPSSTESSQTAKSAVLRISITGNVSHGIRTCKGCRVEQKATPFANVAPCAASTRITALHHGSFDCAGTSVPRPKSLGCHSERAKRVEESREGYVKTSGWTCEYRMESPTSRRRSRLPTRLVCEFTPSVVEGLARSESQRDSSRGPTSYFQTMRYRTTR
jgi:hypothetical protein